MLEQAIRNFATIAERTGETRISSGYRSELVRAEIESRGHNVVSSVNEHGVWVLRIIND